MKKRIYKILIITGVVIAVILVIYFVWRAITAGPEIETPISPDGEGTTVSQNGVQIKKLGDETVFDFWINRGTREVFYFTPDGRVMSAKDGPDLEVSKQTVDALNLISIGPRDQKILAAFGDPRAPQWGIFDSIDKVWRPLPFEIREAAWGSNNEELIVVVRSGNDFNLATADISETPPSYEVLIRDFQLKDINMTFVPDSRLVINELSSASYAGSLWQFDLESLNFNLLIAPEKGLNLKWGRDKNLVFFWGSNSGFLILDENFRIRTPAPFNTLPQKCAAESSRIYCFVPESIPSDAALPDDYLMKKFYSIDDLFSLEIDSGEFLKLFESNTGRIPAIDGKNIQILGDKIYFINRYDDLLYEAEL